MAALLFATPPRERAAASHASPALSVTARALLSPLRGSGASVTGFGGTAVAVPGGDAAAEDLFPPASLSLAPPAVRSHAHVHAHVHAHAPAATAAAAAAAAAPSSSSSRSPYASGASAGAAPSFFLPSLAPFEEEVLAVRRRLGAAVGWAEFDQGTFGDTINTCIRILSKGGRGRDAVESLRRLYGFFSVRRVPRACAERIPRSFLGLLGAVIAEKQPTAAKLLAYFVLSEILAAQVGTAADDSRAPAAPAAAAAAAAAAAPAASTPTRSWENLRPLASSTLPLQLAVRLLLAAAGPSPRAIETNLVHVVHWFVSQNAVLADLSLPFLARTLWAAPDLLGHHRAVESQMGEFLFRASVHTGESPAAAAAAARRKKKGVFALAGGGGGGASSSGAPPVRELVTEVDGTPARDFFTVLCDARGAYTPDQCFNVVCFSCLRAWLRAPRARSGGAGVGGGVEGGGAGGGGGCVSSGGAAGGLSPDFHDVVTSYCLRLLEQAKLARSVPAHTAHTAHSPAVPPSAPVPFSDIVACEALRVLDALCALAPASTIPRVFPALKRVFERTAAGAGSPALLLDLLQFFLHHSDRLVYDPDPVYRAFFAEHLDAFYASPLLAHETLHFCLRNACALRDAGVLATYFPPLLKLLAWHPRALFPGMRTLLPYLVAARDATRTVELFHALLDLPLTACAMERVGGAAGRDLPAALAGVWDAGDAFGESGLGGAEGIADGGATGGDLPSAGAYRVLYNYLLRSESGMSVNFWESTTTRPLLASFCAETRAGPRVHALARRVPRLLAAFFDAAIAACPAEVLGEILAAAAQRIVQMYPLEAFAARVRRVLQIKTLAVFHAAPSLVVSRRDLIIDFIADGLSGDARTQAQKGELVLNFCWAAGEYCASAHTGDVSQETLNDYHEAIELCAYETVSLAKLGGGGGGGGDGSSYTAESRGTIRLLLVLISALAKLAARWQPLASRVILCLSKIVRLEAHLPAAVVERAAECINLLKYPSIASAILDCTFRHPDSRLTHVDGNSSLLFLLETTAPFSPRAPLHGFLPADAGPQS